jgi:hypothetical protein
VRDRDHLSGVQRLGVAQRADDRHGEVVAGGDLGDADEGACQQARHGRRLRR